MNIIANYKLIEEYKQFFPNQFSNQKIAKTQLTKALQNGNSEEAEKIINSRTASDFTETEMWQVKVFKNLNFNDEDFLTLSPEIQSLIYRTANNLHNIPFVKRFNSLGKYTTVQQIKSPSILSQFMDIDTTSQIIFELLAELRQENRLLTKEELDNLNLDCSWKIKRDFTRILGCNHLLKLIKQLNLKHIKVPEKKIIIRDTSESALSFKVNEYNGNVHILMEIDSNNIDIYAQEIKPAKRFLSRDEIIELFTIIEASNYMDIWDHNFIVSEDGIYFIDTEFKSFSVDTEIKWPKLSRLRCFVCEEDQEWFTQLIFQKADDQVVKGRPLQPLPCSLARMTIKFYKEKTKQQVISGEAIDTNLISLLIDCKRIVRQCKLVHSNKKRAFSFPIQDILALKKASPVGVVDKFSP
jgi:hypothetical protein